MKTIYVDSRNGDVLHLTHPIKNVSRVELVAASVPKPLDLDFIFLDILELRTQATMCAQALPFSGESAQNSFAMIQMDVPVDSVKHFKEETDFRVSADYAQPIDKLSRLTIKWLDSTGKPLDSQGVFVLRVHTVKHEVEVPPPPPMLEVELKRIVDAMNLIPPKPETDKRQFGRWAVWVVFLLLVLGYVGYKRLTPSA
jgi:hypothetical protein